MGEIIDKICEKLEAERLKAGYGFYNNKLRESMPGAQDI
jgi:hypothetical protein